MFIQLADILFIGIIMVSLHNQLDWFWITTDKPVVSMKLFLERVSWGGETYPECGSTVQWAGIPHWIKRQDEHHHFSNFIWRVYLCVHIHTSMLAHVSACCMCVCQPVCAMAHLGGQRTIYRSRLPPTMGILGTELRLWGLAANIFTVWAILPGQHPSFYNHWAALCSNSGASSAVMNSVLQLWAQNKPFLL